MELVPALAPGARRGARQLGHRGGICCCTGLEFARVRHGVAAHSFAREDEVSFGAGANETPLTGENEQLCRELCSRLFAGRHPDGSHTDPLFRMQPERWLESRLRAGIAELLPGCAATCSTRRCPRSPAETAACSTCSRWTATAGWRSLSSRPTKICTCPCRRSTTGFGCARSNDDRQPGAGGGRPVSAFERQGYFHGAEVSPLPPRLLLAAPALRIHPANEPVLRYFSPQVEWELIAVTEHWRRELKIVFRKRSGG